MEAVPGDFCSGEERGGMVTVAGENGGGGLGPLPEALGGAVTYDKLHVYRAFKQRK